MDIYEFYKKDVAISLDELKLDKELSEDVQSVLIYLRLLEPPADGKFRSLSTEALKIFQKVTNCARVGILDQETTKKLIETDREEFKEFQLKDLNLSKNDLPSNIIKYMADQGHYIAQGSQEYNIVYVEGMNPNGELNDDRANYWNDLRLIIEIPDTVPIIKGAWTATTEPGRYYTIKPMNRKGAARIKFGQYKSWQVGYHHSQLALVQTAPVVVHRDRNKNTIRDTSDPLDVGLFGINQHHGGNAPRHDIGRWSAGCLVGQTIAGHDQFMSLVRTDRRYLTNRSYTFYSAIIPGDELKVKNQ